jgi:hypothetical protein
MPSGCLDEGESNVVWSYWGRRVRAGDCPKTIGRPEEFAGGESLSLACTQTGLPARQQQALVAAWCEALPDLTGLRTLWIQSRAPQALFDAACRVPGLEGLWLKWNGLDHIDAAAGHTTLRYLYLGQSASLTSLEPVRRMPALRWFQVDGARQAATLEPFRGLHALEGLGFCGGDGKAVEVPSFEPLSGLGGLRWLHLGNVRTADDSLQPLGTLTGLGWLGLGNIFPMAELAMLGRRLPQTAGDFLRATTRFHRSVFPCAKCKANCKVMTSGRGSKLLCPDCDAAKLAKHVAAFEQAAAG